MKVALAGYWNYEMYEQVCADALSALGHEVIPVKLRKGGIRSRWLRRFYNLQLKLMWGPDVFAENRRLLDAVQRHKPEVLWLWRLPQICRRTLQTLRRLFPRMVVASYNNDNAFARKGAYGVNWRVFLNAISCHDLHLVLRHENIPQYTAAGARRTEVLWPYFIQEIHHPYPVPDSEKYDVVFVGHCEPDDRIELVEKLLRADFSVQIAGTYWERYSSPDSPIRRLAPFERVLGESYARFVCRGRTALGLISRHISPTDELTRRNFEIPACGVPMVAPWTPTLAGLFVDGEEAVFYRSHEECLARLKRLLTDPERLRVIGRAGRERVLRDGHDATSRMKKVAGWFEEELNRKRSCVQNQ